VDVDQSFESETVVTSALKGISEAASQSIAAHFDGTFAEKWGGQLTTLGAAQDAVGLPVATWSMETFTVEQYDALLASMKDGSLVVDPTDYTGDTITTVPFENLTIVYE